MAGKEYVAYTQLGRYNSGDVVNPNDWSDEEWKYMVDHDMVVPKNSPNDPAVLQQEREEKEAEEAEERAAEIPGVGESAKIKAGMEAKQAAGPSDEPKKKETEASAGEAKKPEPKTGAGAKPPEPPSSPTVKKEG
jgi:hypothetical protein